MVIAQIEELLIKIPKLQSIMIAVATGESQIQYKQKEYTQLYKNIADLMEFLEEEGVSIKNPNDLKSLSDWRDRWSSLSGYASKGGYIHDLYETVFNQIDIVLFQHYIKDKSQQELVNEWQISRFEDLIAKIQKLKKTLISVATQGKPIPLIKYEEEGYKKLYREVTLQINLLREIGIPALNPNKFRSLCQWYNYWSFELENTKVAREEYINNLYESLLEPIDKALNKYRIKLTSPKEFLQDLQRRFNQHISVKSTTPAMLTTALSNSVQTSTLKLEESFQQQTSEPVADLLSVAPTQAVDNSFLTNTNYTFTWTDENVMNPDLFLEQRDVTPLLMALNNFALKVSVASDRQNFLESAGIDSAFLSNLKCDTPPNIFALALVSGFKNYHIYNSNFNYHPLVNLLESLRDLASIYGLREQDVELFNRLAEKGQENFKALKARNAVCRIESPIGNAIGTGVILKNNLLLTCNHIFSKSQVQKAWVRFGYKAGNYESAKDVSELDFIDKNSGFDYALLKIKEQPQQSKTISINENSILDSGQQIRIIHHPQGKPVVISDLGQIMQVGEAYIDHNLKTDDGSSGAPIFNLQWELIAIHQGKVGIGRNFQPGTTGGIPIRAIWNQISSHFS